MEGRETDEPEERAVPTAGRGGRGPEEINGRGERGTEEPEEGAVGGEAGGGAGRGGRGLSVVTLTEAGNGISSGSSSDMMEGEPTEAGRGGKSLERTNTAAAGGKICMKGLGGGDLDMIEGVLVEGE